jgi:hypothetical protein
MTSKYFVRHLGINNKPKRYAPWSVCIKIKGKLKRMASFRSEEAAVVACDKINKRFTQNEG